MSTVTMCDLCGLTSRVGGEGRKMKIPRDALPDGLADAGGGEANLDVCLPCLRLLRDVFGTFVTGRRGNGELDPTPLTADTLSADPVVEVRAPRDCDRDGHEFVPGLPCCIGCRRPWTPATVEEA